ncbi:hypothetical protein K9L16_03155 [Candidatus Pacearchaeota archaeon]|nr:hypothetical protein [Candidatus Pacearchaeota archaeon]
MDNSKKETRDLGKKIEDHSLCERPDERFFGIGGDKQNNMVLSYCENFYYYNRR